MGVNETKSNNHMIKAGISLALGVLVVLWRVVLPRSVDITVSIVIMTAALDIILTAALIFINRKELKDAVVRKFRIKDFLKIILGFILLYIVIQQLFSFLIQPLLLHINDMPITFEAVFNRSYTSVSYAAWVASEYAVIFPLGIIVSAILASVWEEIAFRMAGRNLIKNSVLYVLITSLLFGFIHTASFFTLSILWYFVVGVVLSIIYLRTKDLRLVIGIHFLNNFIAVLAMTLG